MSTKQKSQNFSLEKNNKRKKKKPNTRLPKEPAEIRPPQNSIATEEQFPASKRPKSEMQPYDENAEDQEHNENGA